ncbi:MAG: hypothetical protein HYW50_01500 [Candidatus Diapherotrites archaeon]|nr:hypothetical protein [Candidatus Diapherotrites archaeon]
MLGAKFENEQLTAELSMVPLGLTQIVLNSKTLLAKTVETSKPVFLTQSSALIEKEIQIKTKAQIRLLEIQTEIEQAEKLAPSTVNVVFRQQTTPFSLDKKKLTFRVQNASDGEKISVFFEILKPLETGFELLEKNLVDENTFEYIFLAKISNTTDYEFKNARINLALPAEEKTLSKTKVFDSTGKDVSFEKTISDSISIFGIDFSPKQKKELIIKFEAKNGSEYWKNFLHELEEKTQALSFSENRELAKKSLEIIGEILQAKNSDLSQGKSVEKIIEISKQVQELESLAKASESEVAKFLEIKTQLEEEIKELKENAAKLEKLGFAHDAKTLGQTISKTVLLLTDAQKQLETNAKEAFISILRAKNALDEFLPQELIEETKKQKNLAMEKAEKLFALKTDEQQKKEIIQTAKEIEDLLSKNEFFLAKEKTAELDEKTKKLEADAKEKKGQEIANKMKKAAQFNSLAQSIPQKIEQLKHLLESKEATELEYFFPTTIERLEKHLLKFNSLATAEFLETASTLSLDENQEISDQLTALQALGNDFEKTVEQLEKIDKELSGDMEKIERDAKTVLDFAIAKSKTSRLNDAGKEALLLAEQKIQNGEFMESMQHSKQAVGLMASAEPPNINIPIAVYPLAAILVFALYFKYLQSKAPKPQKIKIEKAK